ncbi:MAG: carboxylating nicotinate-nucleotide diphosphorylase [Xanthobacteraceae bacterium]|nr:carboxylating nicotinate-nucleotide diphosphorylase [Xanthobacteraceae bacterium]MBX3548550.1 carboxylating nicotinate-nucleotide diphosphorylase [Xanthobacteraceae bacterium]MCW5678288.1 carboxylating nicotinate-nucleotide diphosphorylase [Xanthobacteraceae bacterium]
MTDLVAPGAFLSPLVIQDAVRRALDEDLGRAGDLTSSATLPEGIRAKAKLVARKAGTLAGLPCAARAFRTLAPNIGFEAKARDGDTVKANTTLALIEGPAIAILSGERVALNFLGHLSGIATLTAAYAAKIAHTKAKITDTRKTTPGLRALEKYAVRCGGGVNHRFGLDDAVLIKDNHIAVAGGVAKALDAARAAVGHLVKVEIEVDTLDQLKEVLANGKADVVLLDNMKPETLREAVALCKGKIITEASGGVTLETVAAIAETGVDVISSGALTHSAPSLDVALDIEIA